MFEPEGGSAVHVPERPSQEISILRFADALKSAPEADYDREKWIYIPDFYADYRYVLGTRGARPLICVGVNPSTAAPDALDNTLKSVSRIAAANGFDSWLMYNVYAQRATRPDDMDRELNASLHAENLLAFRYLLELAGEAPAVWAAWGAVIGKRAYLPGCVRDLVALGQARGAKWYCCGARSKAGHPHHPLYLRKDAPLEAFDVEGYLETL